jgi:hypothetical protein
MPSWFRREVPCLGEVLFRGPLAPRPEELDGLQAQGFTATPMTPGPDEQWRLELRHARWGEAQAWCPRGASLPPSDLVAWDPRLSRQEKEEAAAFGSLVVVGSPARTSDILRDRKTLLRFLYALMGSHGLFALDLTAQACWSRGALEDELAHEAALDISSLFTLHLVTQDDEVYWLHSHGLQEIGFCDFDLLDPHPSSHGHGYDALRGLAFAIVEGRLSADGEPFELVHPGGAVRLVSAGRLRAQPEDGIGRRWRDDVDDVHLQGHAVVCDPAGRSWLGLGGRKAHPSGFFNREFPENAVVAFSQAASALMAARARETYALFRALREELDEFELPALVKLGYRIDGGGEQDREHLWFEVHACGADEIEGTLLNQPYSIARLRAGDRGTHPVALISGWTIRSPFGSISPTFSQALREIRSRAGELRGLLAAARSEEP